MSVKTLKSYPTFMGKLRLDKSIVVEIFQGNA